MKINKKHLGILLMIGGVFLMYIYIGVMFSALNKDIALYIKDTIPSQHSISNELVIVEIDDTTLQELGYPLSRQYLSDVLSSIQTTSPSVIGIDILFGEKSGDIEADDALLKTLKVKNNVVLGFQIEGSNKVIPGYFQDPNISYGYFNVRHANNRKVYSIFPSLNIGGIEYESFAFEILKKYFYDTRSIETRVKNHTYNLPLREIPLTKNNEFSIYYTQQEKNPFYHYSFYDIYAGNLDVDFQDKIVLIGYSASGLDEFYFPPNRGDQPGVYLHANIINNVLGENYILYFNSWYESIIILLVISAIVYINIYMRRKTIVWLIGGAVSLIIFTGIAYIILLLVSGVHIFPTNTLGFISIIFFSFLGSAIFKYAIEDKNKRKLSEALSEYVSSDIAQEILYSSGEINLSGEKKRITIFFSDIEGFTSISERLSPEELVAFLRVYLGEMSHIILDHKGFINKYEGDAIMALWGVFGKIEHYGVIQALNAALYQQKKLQTFNQMWESEGKTSLFVRMGIHVGEAIIGNIGAQGRKMEFTALGDSVNLASRLEGINKFYGTNICVSGDVYDIGKSEFVFRYLDTILVKGKQIGVKIYELMGKIGEIGVFKENLIGDFEKAVALYQKQLFGEAKEIFTKLSHLGDNPSKVYGERCEYFIQNTPGEDRDGIWSFDEK